MREKAAPQPAARREFGRIAQDSLANQLIQNELQTNLGKRPKILLEGVPGSGDCGPPGRPKSVSALEIPAVRTRVSARHHWLPAAVAAAGVGGAGLG